MSLSTFLIYATRTAQTNTRRRTCTTQKECQIYTLKTTSCHCIKILQISGSSVILSVFFFLFVLVVARSFTHLFQYIGVTSINFSFQSLRLSVNVLFFQPCIRFSILTEVRVYFHGDKMTHRHTLTRTLHAYGEEEEEAETKIPENK